MNSQFQTWVTQQWQSLNLFSLFFYPLSLVFCFLVSIRRFLFQKHILRQSKFQIPIIIIGNISVGGTGKTPLLLHLVKELKNQKLKVGVISRGYKAQSSVVQSGKSLLIEPNMSAQEVGDEPYLISQHTRVPVVIGHKKSQSVTLLLEHHDCDVIISDDGLQHYALARDIEVCVYDNHQQFGNQLCLPAGPLRESISRLNSVDFLVAHQSQASDELKSNQKISDKTFTMSLAIDYAYHLADFGKTLDNKTSLQDFKQGRIHAIAGIGQPKRFFKQLTKLGLSLNEHPFTDHHHYEIDDFQFDDELPILMTEKDAVKCLSLFNKKDCESLITRLWVVPVKVEISNEFIVNLTNHISKLNS